jgi:hypothetical protein
MRLFFLIVIFVNTMRFLKFICDFVYFNLFINSLMIFLNTIRFYSFELNFFFSRFTTVSGKYLQSRSRLVRTYRDRTNHARGCKYLPPRW